MSFGEYFGAFGSLGDAYREGQDRADLKRYQQDAADLAGKQLDLYLQQQGSGGLGAVQPGGLAGLAGPQASGARLPTFADASGPGGSYISNLFQRESGGNPNARPSTSGAAGLGQFIPSTWNSTARAHPELGLTPITPGAPDPRKDEQQMVAATKALTSDNEAVLNRAGLPVNDATRYALHFLGAGGGPRLVAGAMRNPDAPAASYADPKAVAANRNVFFGRDGSPKSAGQVLNDFSRSFGGGRQQVAQAPVAVPVFGTPQEQPPAAPGTMQMPGVIANPPLPPQRPTQVASADPGFAPATPQQATPGPASAPIRPLQLPPGASGLNPGPAQQAAMPGAPMQAPPGGPVMAMPGQAAPQPAAPSASADEADLPAPNARPAGFQMPPGAQAQTTDAPFVPGTVAAPAIQSGHGQDLPAAQGAPRMSPQQAQFLRAQLANPLTRAQAMQTIQSLGTPEKWETKELGGRVVQVNGRGDVRALPGFDKPVTLSTQKGADGNDYTFNPQTGQWTRAIQGKSEAFADVTDSAERLAAGVPEGYKGAVQRGPDGKLYAPFKAATEVNIDQKGETAFSTTANTAIAKRFEKLSEEGDGARTDSALLGQLRNLGTVVGTGPMAAAQAYLADKGIKLGDNVGAAEAYGAIVDKMVPAQRIPGSGTTSDFDAKGFKSSLPNLMKTPEGNTLIINTLDALNQDKMARAKIAEQALTGEIKPQEAVRQLRALSPPNLLFKSGLAELARAGKLSSQGGGEASDPQGSGQQAPQLKPMGADLMGEARAAIQAGRPAAAVIQRLRERGFDPAGL